MGQCCSKDKNPEKVYGVPGDKNSSAKHAHHAKTDKEKAKPGVEDKHGNGGPENKADTDKEKDKSSGPVGPVDVVDKKEDTSMKLEKDEPVKPPSATPPANKQPQGTNKRNGKNKKPVTKSRDSSSSSGADSSESSDSSDSSYAVKSKVTKTGNTTVYSTSKSKTKVMGNSFNVDNRKGVLNITKIGHQTVVDKLFSGTGYSLEEAREFERRQQNEVPAGSFVNLRQKNLVQEYVFNVQVRADASAWVGIIKLGVTTGTCFRVGTNKIMTALHVIRSMLEKVYISVHDVNPKYPMPEIFVKTGQPETAGRFDDIAHVAVLSKLQDALVDFTFIKDEHNQKRNIFKLKPLTSIRDVLFFDNDTDCIVLELLPNAVGTPMPLQFRYFSYPKLEEGFHIIGHPGGAKKTFDHVNGFIDPGKEKTKRDIHMIKRESQKFLALHRKDENAFPFDLGQNINSKERFLFHCTSAQGASGAPGVVVDEDGKVIVVTMLLCGFPDWYYDPKSESFKEEWPKLYRVEQGAAMNVICAKMSREKPDLCKEIFTAFNNSK